jgi:drug/metabolite transporter (DMT)-like permease
VSFVGKKNSGKWFLIIGLILLGVSFSIYIRFSFFDFLPGSTIYPSEIMILVAFLGFICAIIGLLIWNRNIRKIEDT